MKRGNRKRFPRLPKGSEVANVPASGGHISIQGRPPASREKATNGSADIIPASHTPKPRYPELHMDQASKKERVARAALALIEPGVRLGVGTGSTVNCFIDELASLKDRIAVVVASSRDTEMRLQRAGFEVTELADAGDLDLYVDGADEANARFHLIKGGGGALTREKVLAGASRRFVCIIDDSKWVDVLGRFPLPIEVIPMARTFVARQLARYGGRPVLRQGFVTDNGNAVLDVHDLAISNPPEVERQLNQIPGIVTVGIFAQRPADVILRADDTGVRRMDRR